MPGGNRTGPVGNGPRTGRGLGYCSGYESPGFTKVSPLSRGFGRGLGRGRGFGRGFWRYGRGFWRRDNYPNYYQGPNPYYEKDYPRPSNEEEKSYLENIVKDLESELKQVKERIQALSKEKKDTS